jgi:outer membrane protein
MKSLCAGFVTRRKLYCVFVGLFLSPLSVLAAQNGAFTYEQLVRMAFSQNLGLKIEYQRSQADIAGEAADFRKLLPSFSLSSGRSQTLQNTADPTNELTSYSSRVSLAQPVYQPALWATWRKSQLNRIKADHALQKQQQSLLFEVKRAWYNVLKEQILNTQAKESLARLRQHRKNADALYKSGQIWANDVLQAQVRVARGEQDVFAADNRLALAKSTINLILNRSIILPLSPKGELARVDFHRPFNAQLKQAIENRLEIKQGQIDIDLAKKDREIAQAQLKPTVNFSVSTGATSEKFGYDRASTETIASLNMSWNFWQWGQTNKEIDEANANLQVQSLTLQQQKANILSEVQSAYLTVVESQQSLNVSEQALAQAKENFRVSQIRYKEQLGSSNDVLDAQDLLTQTQTDRVSALSRYLTAIAELDLAVGQEVKF